MATDTSRPWRHPWLRWLLVASLALNLLVAGLVVGDALRGDGPGGRSPRAADLVLGPVAAALRPEDRRAVLESLRGRDDLRPLGREGRGQAFADVVGALRADPFDAPRAERALAAQAERVARAEAAVRAALLARLAAMGAEERAAFADRLEAGLRDGPGRD